MSIGGARYFLIFVDDRSRYTWVYFIRKNSDVFEYFKEFKTMIEKQIGKSIKILRSDQGGEYTVGTLLLIVKTMTSYNNSLFLIHLNKMVLLKGKT